MTGQGSPTASDRSDQVDDSAPADATAADADHDKLEEDEGAPQVSEPAQESKTGDNNHDFGDDFDDFEEGGEEDFGDDFGDFDDGFQNVGDESADAFEEPTPLPSVPDPLPSLVSNECLFINGVFHKDIVSSSRNLKGQLTSVPTASPKLRRSWQHSRNSRCHPNICGQDL